MRLLHVTFDLRARAFLAGKSACVHRLSFERACISAAADLFSRESFNMNWGSKRCVFPFNCQEISKTKGNNNGIIVNKIILGVVPVLKVTIKQYDEAKLTAVSIAIVAFTW